MKYTVQCLILLGNMVLQPTGKGCIKILKLADGILIVANENGTRQNNLHAQ